MFKKKDKAIRKPDLVIFDYDGTIVDNVETMRAIILDEAKNHLSKDYYRVLQEIANRDSTLDNMVRFIIKYCYGNNNFEASIAKAYACEELFQIEVRPTIRAVVRRLIELHIRTCVLTNRWGDSVRKEWRSKPDVEELLPAINENTIEGFYKYLKKPDPEFVVRALRRQNIVLPKDPEVWLVGDTDTDRQTAINCGYRYFDVSGNTDWFFEMSSII